MGDLDFTVRIKTGYQDPTSLMEALGRSVSQGCFRVPARLSPGRPFVLVLTTRLGAAAVKGTAEVVGHEGMTTWVRFLSAADPRADADMVLEGVEVAVSPPEALTRQIPAVSLSEVGEASAVPQPILAHNDTSARRTQALAQGSQSPPQSQLAGRASSPAGPDDASPRATGTGQSPALPRQAWPATEEQQPMKRSAELRPPAPLQLAPACHVESDASGATTAAIVRVGGAPLTGQQPALAKSAVRTGRIPLRPDAITPGSSQPVMSRGDANLSAAARADSQPVRQRPSADSQPVQQKLRTGPQPALAARQTGSQPALAARQTGSQPGSFFKQTGSQPAIASALAGSLPPIGTRTGSQEALRMPRQPPRARTPSKHPRGLQMMPALSIDREAQAKVPPPAEATMAVPVPTTEGPLSATAALLPQDGPLSSNTSPLPQPQPHPLPPADARITASGRTEVRSILPLVSVVPWWTQPADQPPGEAAAEAMAGEDGEPTALDERSDAAKFAAAHRRLVTVNAERDAARSPMSQGEVAGEIAAVEDGPPEPAVDADLGISIADEAHTSTSVLIEMQGGWTSPPAQEPPQWSTVRTVELPAVAPPPDRRLLWGALAVAVACAAIAIGAVWWALELRSTMHGAPATEHAEPSAAKAAHAKLATPSAERIPDRAPSRTSAPSSASLPSMARVPSAPNMASASSKTKPLTAPAKTASAAAAAVGPTPSTSPTSLPRSPTLPAGPPAAIAPAGPTVPAAPSNAAPIAAPAKSPTAAAGAASGCRLHVSANADAAQIFIDGARRGETPATLEVPCQPVAVELRHARYADASRQVAAAPGVTEVELRLTRPMVTIQVGSRPSGAIVHYNGRELGRTPLSTQVPAFENGKLVWSSRNGAVREKLIYPKGSGEQFSATLLASPP